ncbi:restriction endonuclease subunit S [Vibrio lentus]|uniref:restriction endonuclease subunit S n=1 Tax=Vibrio lentus TaxID=136468 RepID=UPI00247AB221|nr:restriction endonuclease subunit S [Vibrio lentus]WGS59676.1 restriction endonuclease subunit S [Vibrio lentus]
MSKYQAYPEYKDSGVEWLEHVPSCWDVIKIKHLSPVKRGASPRPIDDPKFFDEEGEYAWVRIADVSASETYLEKTTQTMSELGSSLSVKLEPNQLFLSIAGTVGKPCLNKIKACIHDGFVYFPELNIPNKYLFYVFAGEQAYKGLGKMGTQLNLNTDTVGDIKVALPKEYEHISHIVRFLDHETAKIDTLINKQQQLIKLLKEKRQSVINHAVTKGLNPDVPMKDSGVEWLGEVPEHWDLVPLKYLCRFSGGGTPSKDNLAYWTNGTMPWVSPKDMKTFWVDKTQDYITDIAVKESSTNLVETGSLLMVVRSGILQRTIPIAINTIPVTLNQDMKALRFNERMTAIYAANYIVGNVDKLLLEWSKEGATVESIEHEYLTNSLFPVPPVEEQQQIVDVLKVQMDRYDQLEQRSVKGIKLLSERRTALISAAVTGKIDVRNWQVPVNQEAQQQEAC